MTVNDEQRRNLVEAFLNAAGLWTTNREKYLLAAEFEQQDDGGMGSFTICHPDCRKGTRDYAEAQYTDADGQKVIVALIGDDDGYPTDIDFWKVDNTPLVRFPNPQELAIKHKR